MPRRNRNSGTEPLDRDRLADDAAQLARELRFAWVFTLSTRSQVTTPEWR